MYEHMKMKHPDKILSTRKVIPPIKTKKKSYIFNNTIFKYDV
jgi:uncharacterized short protein YbdD (DUF466 family)